MVESPKKMPCECVPSMELLLCNRGETTGSKLSPYVRRKVAERLVSAKEMRHRYHVNHFHEVDMNAIFELRNKVTRKILKANTG